MSTLATDYGFGLFLWPDPSVTDAISRNSSGIMKVGPDGTAPVIRASDASP